MTQLNLERLAYRLAGRAVAGAHLGLPTEAVASDTNDPEPARRESSLDISRAPGDPLSLRAWARLHNRAVALLAGGVAVRRYDPAAPADNGDSDAAADLMSALAPNDGVEQRVLGDYLAVRAEALVERLWIAVRFLARSLLEHGRQPAAQRHSPGRGG
jgi:hypothetical protein